MTMTSHHDLCASLIVQPLRAVCDCAGPSLEIVTIRIAGNPITQGNKTGFVNRATGRVVMREGRTASAAVRFGDWRHAIADEARRAAERVGLAELEAGPVRVSLAFTIARPASHPKTRRTWPIGKRSGDVDKLARAVLDAITGVLIVDDGQVTRLEVDKDYGPTPGVEVTLWRWPW